MISFGEFRTINGLLQQLKRGLLKRFTTAGNGDDAR